MMPFLSEMTRFTQPSSSMEEDRDREQSLTTVCMLCDGYSQYNIVVREKIEARTNVQKMLSKGPA